MLKYQPPSDCFANFCNSRRFASLPICFLKDGFDMRPPLVGFLIMGRLLYFLNGWKSALCHKLENVAKDGLIRLVFVRQFCNCKSMADIATRCLQIWEKILPDLISESLRMLLQENHLYQKLVISDEKCKLKVPPTITNPNTPDFENAWKASSNRPWVFHRADLSGGAVQVVPSQLLVEVKGIKLYCPICSRLEAFNPYSSPNNGFPVEVLLTEVNNPRSRKAILQVFSYKYECQSCKKHIVVFLVERDDMTLRIAGRSPIESIDIPNYVPKNIASLLGGSVLAFNSGQHLPAIFMLRTTIEQYMRSLVKIEGKISGEDLADKYAETLPEDFRKRFQSLKPIYVALSEAIHSAKADEVLFQRERANILRHLEAKDAFDRLSANNP